MLTDRAIINLKPREKQYKVSDGNGLQLTVSPNGCKTWCVAYRYPATRDGKQKRLTLGRYPSVTLREAREQREEARDLIFRGIDPGEHKKKVKRLGEQATGDAFAILAREWYGIASDDWKSAEHRKNVLQRMERYLVGNEEGKDESGHDIAFGKLPITEITPQDILQIIRPIEARGAFETSHRIMQLISNVFGYAVSLGKIQRNITVDMKGLLKSRKEKHHPSITDPKKVGELLRAIDGYEGNFIVKCAMQLAPLTFVRPGELRGGEWAEVNFDNAEWRIPAERMKMGEPHVVPLSTQAVRILRELHQATGQGKYLFPSVRTNSRCMSENTVNGGLRRLGYTNDEMTGHGFRSMASTLLNELGWNRDWVERQLSHAERNSVRGAYNYAEFLPNRRTMMQEWADYLDRLKNDR